MACVHGVAAGPAGPPAGRRPDEGEPLSAIEPIKITGLRDFQAALKRMDGESQKQLRVVLNSAASTVAAGASRRVPRKTGRAAASLRAQSSQREAKVVGGSKKAPYYGWLDFGGRIGRDKATRRPFVQSGRYMYPTFSASRDSIYSALQRSLMELAVNAGLEATADGG